MMKHIILLCAYLLSLSAFAQFSVSGGSETPYEYEADAETRLNKVYIVYGINGVTLSYTHNSGDIIFYRYKQSANDKEQIPSSQIKKSISGGKTTYEISNLQDNTGYFAESSAGIELHSIWMIDYSLHPSTLTSISLVEKTDPCSPAQLQIQKSGDLLSYYGTNERKKDVSRIYTLEYSTLEWNDTQFNEKIVSHESEFGEKVYIASPLLPALKDTRFLLKGDRIATHFKQGKQVESGEYHATEIRVEIRALQADENGKETEIDRIDPMGAPLEVHFYGHANEPVASNYKWVVTNDKDPSNDLLRYTRDFDYIFTQAGKYKATLEVSNREYQCIDSTFIEFAISESSLDIPNYFSPGSATDGRINEFKVTYKSLIRFKCSIFNRWGNKVYEYTDPALGWDGKYKGSYVSPGVYFYVIDAEGSDGIRYKKGGDINILHKK